MAETSPTPLIRDDQVPRGFSFAAVCEFVQHVNAVFPAGSEMFEYFERCVGAAIIDKLEGDALGGLEKT